MYEYTSALFEKVYERTTIAELDKILKHYELNMRKTEVQRNSITSNRVEKLLQEIYWVQNVQ